MSRGGTIFFLTRGIVSSLIERTISLTTFTKIDSSKYTSPDTYWGGWLVMDMKLQLRDAWPTLSNFPIQSYDHFITPLGLFSYCSIPFKAQSKFSLFTIPQTWGLKREKWLNKVDGDPFLVETCKGRPTLSNSYASSFVLPILFLS